jgi:hypothetical protein
MPDQRTRSAAARPPVERRPASPEGGARRGRPPKFGRPAQVVAITLPEEVIAALRTVHQDLGWAIVRLTEPLLGQGRHRQASGGSPQPAELAYLPGRRALIVVAREALADLPGVDAIPLADGRAFLALEPGRGIADLELAILDRLEATAPGTPQRRVLATLRETVRSWRRNPHLAFRTQSIIVIEGATRAGAPLAALQRAESRRTVRRRRAAPSS